VEHTFLADHHFSASVTTSKYNIFSSSKKETKFDELDVVTYDLASYLFI